MSNVKEVQNGEEIVVKPVAGRIGAEISGIQLSRNLDPQILQSSKEAILKYKVVFIRHQGHLDDQEQEAFASLLGKPIVHPTVPAKDGSNYILELNSDHGGRANSWHTDVTFEAAYPKYSILRAVVLLKQVEIPFGQTLQLPTKTYHYHYETSPINYGLYTPMNMIMLHNAQMYLLKRFNMIKMYLPLRYTKQNILSSMYTQKQVNVIYYSVICEKICRSFFS